MTRPRIAMVLNSPGFGGVTEVAFQLIDHLPRDRFELSVYHLKDGNTEDPARRARMGRLSALGVECAAASGNGGKVGVVAELATWLSANRIDILHTHSFRPNIYGRMAGVMNKPAGLRMISHYHNHYDDKWIAGSAALSLERSLAASTDAMIAVSRQVATHVADAIGVATKSIMVVENAVDATRFRAFDRATARRTLGLDAGRPIVGLVGRVCEQKGQDDLAEAAIRLKDRLPDVQFVVFGDIEDKTLHKRLVQRIGLADLSHRFTFAGHVANTPAVYAAIDLLTAPSRWEGFPLVIAEAMASGCPIVATSVGAVPDMVRDGESAILVAPRDPDRLAAAIESLVGAPRLRCRYAAAARARAGCFSWQHAADRVAAIYDRLIRSPGSER